MAIEMAEYIGIIGTIAGLGALMIGAFAWGWANLNGRIDCKVSESVCNERHKAVNDNSERLERIVGEQARILQAIDKRVLKIAIKLGINDDES